MKSMARVTFLPLGDLNERSNSSFMNRVGGQSGTAMLMVMSCALTVPAPSTVPSASAARAPPLSSLRAIASFILPPLPALPGFSHHKHGREPSRPQQNQPIRRPVPGSNRCSSSGRIATSISCPGLTPTARSSGRTIFTIWPDSATSTTVMSPKGSVR